MLNQNITGTFLFIVKKDFVHLTFVMFHEATVTT